LLDLSTRNQFDIDDSYVFWVVVKTEITMLAKTFDRFSWSLDFELLKT
jgi:hypothetical protein